MRGDMLTDKAKLLGFIAASIVPALLLAIFAPLSGDGGILAFIVSFAFCFPFFVFATALFGAPLFVLLERFKLVFWWTALIGGAVIGVAMVLLISFGGQRDPLTIAEYASLGALSGFVFWVVARIASRKQMKNSEKNM
jgi:hypothetical protein